MTVISGAGVSGAANALRSFDHLQIAARILKDATALQKPLGGEGGPASIVSSLLQQYQASGSIVEQGALLRSLDTVSGGRQETNGLLRGDATSQVAKGTAAAKPAAAPKYDASSLYGKGGPKLADIQQDSFGDCYYIAVLGAVADKTPGVIKNAIKYDAKSQSFNVTLFGANGKPQKINVTQAEIDSNIARGGGSQRDNGVSSAPIWPDVMEVAYAKQLDTNHKDGIEEGYGLLAGGGDATNSYRVITGKAANFTPFSQSSKQTKQAAMDALGTQVQTALKSGKPVTLDTKAENDDRNFLGRLFGTAITQDGLVDSHTYIVTGMSKDSKGEWQVTLRNPWNRNDVAAYDEGHNTASAFVTVPLSRLVNTGGLSGFDITK